MHFDRLWHGHMRAATPRRRWAWLLRDLETLAGASVLLIGSVLLADGVGHVLGYLWWCVGQVWP